MRRARETRTRTRRCDLVLVGFARIGGGGALLVVVIEDKIGIVHFMQVRSVRKAHIYGASERRNESERVRRGTCDKVLLETKRSEVKVLRVNGAEGVALINVEF